MSFSNQPLEKMNDNFDTYEKKISKEKILARTTTIPYEGVHSKADIKWGRK